MTHPVATLPKLTVKELAALKAIDASEYGDFLTDAIWSFSIADNIPNTAGIARTSVPGIVSSLNKKGYVRNGTSDGEKTVEMTHEGALAYIAANGGKSRKHVDHDALVAAGKVAAATIIAAAETEVDAKKAPRAKKTAEEKRLAKNARAARRRAARKAAKAQA